jgi:membrane fusion protein (multidrug efflux system)
LRDPGEKVALRSIKVGDRVESFFVVLDGLKAGERVIVEGIQKVQPGMVVKPTTQAMTVEPGGPTAPTSVAPTGKPPAPAPERQTQPGSGPGARGTAPAPSARLRDGAVSGDPDRRGRVDPGPAPGPYPDITRR